MFNKYKGFFLGALLSITSNSFLISQEEVEKSQKQINQSFTFFNFRGPIAIDVAGGSSLLIGDYKDPEFESYFRAGLKIHITSHLNINITYNKYNIAFDELYNEGFMSFDLNWELLLSPYKRLSPYLYAGGGYNASNYFENTTNKIQGGLGIEFIVTERLGLKLFGEYNYAFSSESDGLIIAETDESFIRMGIGMNIYFGGVKKREALRQKLKTIINSNPIISNY